MFGIVDKYNKLSIQAKASLWFFACSFIQKAISTISTPIFTRLLTTAEYGQYNVFISWYGILSIFVTMRLSYGVYAQGLVKFESDRKKFSSTLQGLNLFLCISWLAVYFFTREYWNHALKLTTLQMIAMFSMMWTTSVFEFWSSEQRVVYSYKKLVFITLITSFAKPVVGILLVRSAADKVTARIIGIAVVELIGFSGLFFIQLIRGKKLVSKYYWKYAISFNLPLIPHYLSQTVLNNSDRIMIEKMVGKSEAGIYSLAYSIALLMTLVNVALMNTISPWIYQKIKTKKTEDISGVAYLTLVIIAVANIGLIAFAPEAVYIFAPHAYHEAIYVIPPIAMSVFFLYCYDLFAKVEFYYEKTKQIMLASVIGAILNIVLNYIFIGKYGYIAAGYTTMVCYGVYALMHFWFMELICKKEQIERIYNPKVLLGITVVFTLVGFLMLLTYEHSIVRYSIICTMFLLIILNKRKVVSIINTIRSTGFGK